MDDSTNTVTRSVRGEEEIRRESLDQAIKHLGGNGDAGVVVGAARTFETYLKGDSRG